MQEQCTTLKAYIMISQKSIILWQRGNYFGNMCNLIIKGFRIVTSFKTRLKWRGTIYWLVSRVIIVCVAPTNQWTYTTSSESLFYVLKMSSKITLDNILVSVLNEPRKNQYTFKHNIWRFMWWENQQVLWRKVVNVQ